MFRSIRRTPALFLSLALAFLFVPIAHAQDEKPDCHILSAGIDAYQQSPLKGCVNDARNVAKAFQSQEGKMFGKVSVQLLLDQQATTKRLQDELQRLDSVGKAGDFMVVFLSGHGGRQPHWYFCPQEAGGKLPAPVFLDRAERWSAEGKKVLLIVDACYAGHLRLNARAMLEKSYPHGGGLVVMVSSMPSQESLALGHCSAFAQAVYEGLCGHADLNADGFVTLGEIRRFAYQRTHELVKKGNQDGEVDYSVSIGENLKLAQADKKAAQQVVRLNQPPRQPTPPPPPAETTVRLDNTEWVGQEDLAGFGQLGFRLLPGRRALMLDESGTTAGVWTIQGRQVTLVFNNGQTTYVGVLQGEELRGSARGSRGQTWNWSVTLRPE